MQETAISQADKLKDILSQFSSGRNVEWNNVDLDGITNAYDRRYVTDLIKTMRSLDPGNKHLRLGMNLEMAIWAFWLIHFKGEFTETHFRIIRSIPHSVQGWVPIKDGGIRVKANVDFGVCLWVFVDPLPQNSLLLGGPPEHLMLPSPGPAPVFRVPDQTPAPNEKQKKQRSRDESPKRGLLGGMVRLLVGPKKSSEGSESS
jgi:hypothetical protein